MSVVLWFWIWVLVAHGFIFGERGRGLVLMVRYWVDIGCMHGWGLGGSEGGCGCVVSVLAMTT